MSKKNPTKISELELDDKNFNKHTEFGTSLLEKSLRKFGAGRSILLDKNNKVIAGNGITESAVSIGLEDVQVIESDGKRIIAVKRTDIDLDTPEGRELALADNATSKANLNFDTVLIEEMLTEEVMSEWGIESQKESFEDDFVADPPKDPITKLGDVYELNQHRFSCGDSCDASVVEKTLGGANPILMVTDPPYGVNYNADWRNHTGIARSARAIGKVTNDDKADWLEAFKLFAGDIIYCWHASASAIQFANDIMEAGFEIKNQIIWAKNNIVIGRGDYHWKHEPCWYAVRKGVKHNWQGSRKETTVWEIDKPQKSETGHSTQKPIECMARPIRNNTYERQSIYDPFLGSGTTLIAAEQLNRACYGQEIDCGYCDIIVARWVKFMQSQNKPYEIKRNGTILTDVEVNGYLAQIELDPVKSKEKGK